MSNEAKTHVIDGKTYVEIEREAKVGEYVINNKGTEDEEYFLVTGYSDEYLPSYTVDFSGKENDEEYTVAVSIERSITLEPVDQAPSSTDDLIANLVRRVHSLERQVNSLSTQLRDTQNNLERQGVEIAEIDERTQPKQCEDKSVPTTGQPQVFDLAKIKPFKMSDLDGKTLRVHSATDTAEGISVTTTVAIDEFDGKMYVLESEVVSR